MMNQSVAPEVRTSLSFLRTPWRGGSPLRQSIGRRSTFLKTVKLDATQIFVAMPIRHSHDEVVGEHWISFRGVSKKLLIFTSPFALSTLVILLFSWPPHTASFAAIVSLLCGVFVTAYGIIVAIKEISVKYYFQYDSDGFARIGSLRHGMSPQWLAEAPCSRCVAITVRGIRFTSFRGRPLGVIEVKGVVVDNVVWFYGIAKAPRRVPDPDWLPPEMPRVKIREHMIVDLL